MKNKVEEMQELHLKNEILEHLRDKKIIETDGNIVNAEKAFIINAFTRWVYKEKKAGHISAVKIKHLNKALDEFLKGNLDLQWENNVPIFKRKTIDGE